MPPIRVGTAGWTIPRSQADKLPGLSGHLDRYSRALSCTEINSTFYRPSRHSTWLRWAASVPEDFRFSVKAPKTISHEAALELTSITSAALDSFLDQVRLLGSRLGPILFQLPPSQAFNRERTHSFFSYLRTKVDSAIVIEPRHASWFSADAESLMTDLRLSRVAADPARVPEASVPGGLQDLLYYRLHGSPRMYYSEYTPDWLAALAAQLRSRPEGTQAWVIFDNTASGAALGNALELAGMLPHADKSR